MNYHNSPLLVFKTALTCSALLISLSGASAQAPVAAPVPPPPKSPWEESPGLGYYFIKSDRTSLRGEIGPSFIYENRGGVTHGYVALRLAERFEHKLSETAHLWESVEFLPQVDKFKNYLINAELGVEAALT